MKAPNSSRPRHTATAEPPFRVSTDEAVSLTNARNTGSVLSVAIIPGLAFGGSESAGAMREWGRHATALIGRRQFDDADLIERRFQLAPATETLPKVSARSS